MTYKQPTPIKPMAKPFATAPDFSDPAIRELVQMHTTCRPAGSKSVDSFCAKYLDHIPGMTIDEVGNRVITVGSLTKHPVMWSSHTDTVHRVAGTQKVLYGGGLLSLHEKSPSSCLGADCTVGVWLTINMIRRNVPGLYIFHAAEEVGGLGSDYIAKQVPDLLDGIKYAIAFDRRGTTSIITHQGSRCCSDSFAHALADQLGGSYGLDTGGTFTDTANYTHLIPECTNISVGYYNAHQATEYLDVSFAAWLLERLCALDINALPVLRDTLDNDYAYDYGGWSSTVTKAARSAKGFGPTLEDLVWDNPEVAAIILQECGITADDFQDVLNNYNRKH